VDVGVDVRSATALDRALGGGSVTPIVRTRDRSHEEKGQERDLHLIAPKVHEIPAILHYHTEVGNTCKLPKAQMARRIKQSIEDRSRLEHPKMETYRRIYHLSREYRGDGELEGKTVIVYGEQGYGDIIQFARYVPALMNRKCHVIVHCPTALHRLFQSSKIGHEWLDRESETLPTHEYHIPMMSLPFLKFREKLCPYLSVKSEDVFQENEQFKIGIAWEGNPDHSNNSLRSCPLNSFKGINELPGTRTYMLQSQVNLPEYAEVDEEFQIYSTERKDFYDTACLIAGMDMVISVDTSVLHLAGALGKTGYGLLSVPCDYRWQVHNWYPSITLMRDHQGQWKKSFDLLKVIASNHGMVQVSSKVIKNAGKGILITGGIGDFLALESHMSVFEKNSLTRIYLATRANSIIKNLIEMIGIKAEVLEIFADYDNVTFYQKSEVSLYLKKIGCPYPSDWSQVEDWSILVKFPEIQDGMHPFNGTSIFDAVPAVPVTNEYVVICPMTETDVDRKLDQQDWKEITRHLENRNLEGVVVAGKNVECPEHPLLTNISGKTSMLESIACLKGASGYFGIDSFMSILAAQRFDITTMRVKSINEHLYRHRDIYYAPHRDGAFVSSQINLSTSSFS
jgi:ADP-heptose:LPS heptosyltransferase